VSERGPRKLVKGNVALAEGAVQAGLHCYFGYPITPQNEIPEYLSARLPETGGVFLQAESELASINMVLGAASTGVRAMTSSSSPGISLMQEGISFLAGSQIPCVVVNVSRSGPGLGGIKPSQGDYYQATRGGGHGDYRTIVLAPATVQEMFDSAALGFELAEKYRNPVLILADAVIGQMAEGAYLKHDRPIITCEKPWTLTGAKGRPPQNLRSMYLEGDIQEELNNVLRDKYQQIEQDEVLYKEFELDDAEVVVVAFGTAARIALSAVQEARQQGIKAGLFRPFTLYPFPFNELRRLSERVRGFLDVELNLGQMVDDVRAAVQPGTPVHFLGRPGGGLPSPDDIIAKLKEL
jgi:2-oxoglutarate/2-oxoacid ferredoxin oxidoreductase subunit alpha